MYTTESHPNHALPQPAQLPIHHSHQAAKDAVRAVDIPCGRVFPDGVVRYIVEVAGSESTWLIAKRYSQFETLHLDLIQLFLDLVSLPDLPPKKLKLFQSHNSPAFIEKRAVLLTNYLRKLLDNKKLVNSKLVHDFFTTDKFTDPTLTTHRKVHATAPTASSPSSNTTLANNTPLPASSSFSSPAVGSAASTAPSTPVDPSPLLSSSPGTPPTSSVNFRLPADSEITTLSIPTHRVVNGHVLFAIHCYSEHRPAPLAHWTQLKRFSQLVAMDERLRSSLFAQYDEAERRRRLDAIPDRPAKRVSLGSSGGGEDRGFIEERRVLMEHYLRSLLLNEECRKNMYLLEFLGVEG